ncbi:hypothetical protein QKT49_gp400 [Acanthamoeba castellanii medusavirus]|uniref:Uncharacterized protein n=1 Tax=Acanthamoeba castellanii medusavirus J1 TaxID=3114988 RepID=A0A3T1CX03_9VIRU|nr:hypothetical protein QKT49_gp400 [Acanthamoeba castellanii medusavirus]BBI30363.1 hypothetical protein [Acanthamoeba castellanii medusavirus J1]
MGLAGSLLVSYLAKHRQSEMSCTRSSSSTHRVQVSSISGDACFSMMPVATIVLRRLRSS